MSGLDDLMESILLEDILEREGLDYKIGTGSRGEQLNIHECPFCGGDDWKVYANRDSGLGNCFHGSCQETFNVFKFTRKTLDNRGGGGVGAYLNALAMEMGWRPAGRQAIDIETYDAEDWALPANIALPDTKGRMLDYLLDRGIDGETARWFDLRYSNDSWYKYQKNDGSEGFMPFKKRVIFPIFDLDGTMVTFQGRDITNKAERKYLFPPRLPGTGRFLYNGHRAARKKHLVLCEGVMDVIAANSALAGRTDIGVVGSFGMHLSTGDDGNDQLSRFMDLKARGLETVTILWDGEKKAYEAAIKTARKLCQVGIQGKVATLPRGKDPGDARSADILAAIEGARSAAGTASLTLMFDAPYK